MTENGRLEPGEPFTISYGKGHTIEAHVLSCRQLAKAERAYGAFKKLALVDDADDTTSEDVAEMYETLENAIRVCIPEITDEQLDTMDVPMHIEVINSVLNPARLSGDEAKKCESQPT